MKEKYIEMFGAEGKKLGEVRFDGKRIFTNLVRQSQTEFHKPQTYVHQNMLHS